MDARQVIAVLNQYMIEKGKRELSLRTANEVLRNQEDETTQNIDLKKMLESDAIPHAYQTDTVPKLWYIPYAPASEYDGQRKAYLASQKTNLNAPVVNETVTEAQTSHPLAIYLVIAAVAGILYLVFAGESPTPDAPLVRQHQVKSTAPETSSSPDVPLGKYTLRSTTNDNERFGKVTQTNNETTYHIFDFINRTVTMKAPMNGKLLTFNYPMKNYYKEPGLLATTYVIVVNDNGVEEIWFSPDVPNLGYDYIDGTRMAYYEITLLD